MTVENIECVINTYTERCYKEYISKLVPSYGIEAKDYILSVSIYIEQEDTRENIDITALNKTIEEIVARKQILYNEIDKIVAKIEAE